MKLIMMNAYKEAQPIFTETIHFISRQNRHLIRASRPRTVNGEMLIELCVDDWDKDLCFHYNVDSIDSKIVRAHFIWKFSSDEKYVLIASADMDIAQLDYRNLNIRNWKCE